MDANKKIRLTEIKYRILRSCGTCRYAVIISGAEFGVCKRFTYEHEKHTESLRLLSVNRYGVCEDYQRSALYPVPEGWECFEEGALAPEETMG